MSQRGSRVGTFPARRTGRDTGSPPNASNSGPTATTGCTTASFMCAAEKAGQPASFTMTFGEFRKELEKQKIAIAIKELMDYQELFDTHATQIKAIQQQIKNTEKTIDKLVYELYKLTHEEIKIIENQ